MCISIKSIALSAVYTYTMYRFCVNRNTARVRVFSNAIGHTTENAPKDGNDQLRHRRLAKNYGFGFLGRL